MSNEYPLKSKLNLSISLKKGLKVIHDSNLIRDSSMHYPADLPLAVHEGPGHGVADETRRDALEGQLKGRQPGTLS